MSSSMAKVLMGVPYKSVDIHGGFSTYMNVQDAYVSQNLYPVMIATAIPIQYQTQGFPRSLPRHTFSTPPVF